MHKKGTMKAIIIDKPGPAEQMKIGEWDKPIPGENEILVKVEATALNRADILQREGKYPPPRGASPIMGLEMAGTVVSQGKNSRKWKTGDRVFGLLPGGGYAEYAVIHKEMAMAIPENLSYTEAAAIPEVFLTAFQALRWLGKIKEKETVLIHAGASGVGTAAIQIAREHQAEILVTASAKKHEYCLELGASYAIDYKKGPFKDEVLKITKGEGVNIIIDFIGGSYFSQNIDSLMRDGRMIILATLGGGKATDCDIRKILTKRLSIMGSTLRSRTRDYQIKLTNEFADFALPRFSDGRLKPIIDTVFTWDKVKEAHQVMEANKNVGKIVLKVN